MSWNNVALWMVQIALLATVAAALAAIFQLRPAPARLVSATQVDVPFTLP